ncbi:HAMP domain-containing sensor histidine kinase [Parasporobacterium paucivorans]|uniref:HAMP domain-containing sensor histidine kinase n=1 Tax=Parasporobacterium paucivorans TaxID=115544 RepID=UPI0015C035F0|nr:HAMP domain-containing sensor histidine kinase [Parasporobacterium paucivorans]
MFIGFAVIIVGVVFFIQLFNIKQRVRQDTLDSLRNITWNISATYGTDAYYKAMRAAAYSGEYQIKTMTEDGEELDSVGVAGLDARWPLKILKMDNLIEQLKNSNGYIDYVIEDGNTDWVVHAQVLASWEGKREIIFVAKSTDHEKAVINNVQLQLLEISLIVFAFALLMSWFLARQFLKPIVIITNSAKKLANGDYSVSFPQNTYAEINLLSETMEMAAREFANYEQNRRDLIANVSHDMRTPLTMIKAYAEMILNISGDNQEKRDRHLGIIIEQTDKLSIFVNASLNLAKLQSKETKLQLQKFSLGRLVNEVIEHLKVIYGKDAVFETKIFEKYMIKADKPMIEQVLFNVIINAVKYSGGPIYINVRCEGKHILFEVIDHGVGIAGEDLPNIWIKYYKINPGSKDFGSTGVGLSIVKEILDQHNFEYGVDSEPGKGSRFWFRA